MKMSSMKTTCFPKHRGHICITASLYGQTQIVYYDIIQVYETPFVYYGTPISNTTLTYYNVCTMINIILFYQY